MKPFRLPVLAAMFILALSATAALTGTGGADLDPLWNEIADQAQGPGGKILGAFGMVASMFAIMRGQTGIGAVLFLSVLAGGLLPSIVASRFTALF